MPFTSASSVRGVPGLSPPALAANILGVPLGANHATVTAAWRRMKAQHHPDRARDPAAAKLSHEMVRAVDVARDILIAGERPALVVALTAHAVAIDIALAELQACRRRSPAGAAYADELVQTPAVDVYA